jgi:hypothetical protein
MPPAPRKSTTQKTATKKSTTRKAPAKKATAKKVTAPKTPGTTRDAVGGGAASGTAALAQAGVTDAVVRIRELQAQLLEAARRGGASYLQAYEKNLSSMLQLTERAAESTQLSWAVTLANTYADFVKGVNDAVMKAGWRTLG